MADRSATKLSGGQQQRVALARCLASHPKLILLSTSPCRIWMRSCASRCASSFATYNIDELGITSLYVTHDLEEALAMSDRIVVMRDGLVEQTGTPDEVHSLPRSELVADFIGCSHLIPWASPARSGR